MIIAAILWKKILKFTLLGLLLIGVTGWIVIQSIFTFRKADHVVIQTFKKMGMTVHISDQQIGAHTLHFATTGADTLPTLLLMHGSPGGWIEFEDYLADKELQQHFRLISVDRPGFGYSSDYGTGLDLFEQGKILIPFLKALDNGKPLYLMGHSLGGPIVALLAAEAPDMVNGIVVAAGALDPNLEPKEGWRKILKLRPFRYLVNRAFQASNDELFYFKKDVWELKPHLSKITCPVLIVHAEDDMLVNFGNVEYMKQQFTHAKSMDFLLFPTGNHFIHHNHFEIVKHKVIAFAESVAPSE